MGFFDAFKKREEVPFTPLQIVQSDSGIFDGFYGNLTKRSLVVLINGKRGSGKTSLGMKLLELVHRETKRPCYGIGYDSAKLPSWLKRAKLLEDIPNNSVVLIDEGAVQFSSRESMKDPNRQLSKLMSIARHKNLSLFLITQSSAMIDLNVIRLADAVLLKEPSLLQSKFERKALKDMFEKVEPIIKKQKERIKYFYVFSDEFEGLVKYDLPAFWNEGISMSFKDVK